MRQKTSLACIWLFAAFGFVSLLGGCATSGKDTSVVERGKYLVMVGGCEDCHSPKIITGAGAVPDAARQFSGYPSGVRLPAVPQGIIAPDQWGALTTSDMTAWAGPWGVSFASNLTPHRKTGIGNWSETIFFQALKKGKLMGTSRDLLPPMPWQTIGKMADEDLKAIFAYLQTMTPIDNEVPLPAPPPQQ